MFQVIINYHDAFLLGLAGTLKLASIAWGVGLFLGLPLGLFAARSRQVSFLVQLVSFLLSGIPVLVLLFWLHYPAQQLLGIVVDPFFTAALILAIINLVTVEETIRSASEAMPNEFRLAGIVCGMKERDIIWQIELPLLGRHVIGSLLVSQVAILHMTLFASLISVDELLRMSQRVNSLIYKPIEIYSALGLFFLAVSLPVNGVALLLRKRFGRDLSER
jgi:ABC-type amino acid transport system permease subunit